MTWVRLEVLEHRGRVANHGALGLVFVCFWLQWLLPDARFTACTLTGWQLPGLLTHPFIHGHSLHLIWNLALLHIFGGLASNALGPARYAAAWLAFTLAGATGHLLAGGAQAAGASGVIAGFVGFSVASRTPGQIALLDGALRVPTHGLALALVVKDILFAFLPGMGVSVGGHLGGYVAGALLGWIARR
jgi:membrane associated rhomboid family serine protease